MKVLIVGSAHEAAMEHAYTLHLTEMRIPNQLFPAQNIFYDYYYSTVLNKIKFRLGLSGILNSINRQLIQKVQSYRPDVLLVFNALANADLPVDVYGNHWNQYKLNKKINVFGPAYGTTFWKTLRRYRVQLNLMRPHNLGSHNMRSIEVPAIGGIGLFPNTPDH